MEARSRLQGIIRPATEETSIEVDLRDQDQSTRAVARRMARDGTIVIAIGSLVAGIAAYLFQIIGGRALGDEGFAPVAALLSIHSLILAVLLTPVELLTVRRLTLTRGGAPDEHDRRAIAITIAAAVGVMVGFIGFTLGHYFENQGTYILIGAVVVITHAVFALGRGALAGRGRYVAYGVASGTAALLRVALALAWLGRPTDIELAWAVALPPLIILLWKPFRRRQEAMRVPGRAGSGSLMAGFVLSGAISQAFVLVGPLVAGAIEPDQAAVATVVSVVFVTFSLARAPLLLAQNLAARLLAGLTKLVARTDYLALRRWSRRLGLAGLAVAPLAYLGGAWLGPPVIELLFGPGFRPSSLAAGLATAACALAAASVFLDQVLIALGATGKLAGAWTVALAVSTAALILSSGTAEVRVGVSVLAGELAALVAVLVAGEMAVPESPDSGYDLAKRAMDLIGSAVLLLITLPIQLAMALAVKIDSPGPVFFNQTRVGKNDRPFTMTKFRTMAAGGDDEALYEHLANVAVDGTVRPQAVASGPHLYIDQDQRVTRVGRWLRKFSLDELPNLWNVLRGHMSLVGPRPLVPAEVELLDAESRARHKVRPGMTGLAQVKGGSDITFGERAYWDLQYIEHRSLALDIQILWRTPVAALRREDHTEGS
jgi:lipopolysaccharide/colanic/teichoic acid biosynthesis glycosyltransferase